MGCGDAACPLPSVAGPAAGRADLLSADAAGIF